MIFRVFGFVDTLRSSNFRLVPVPTRLLAFQCSRYRSSDRDGFLHLPSFFDSENSVSLYLPLLETSANRYCIIPLSRDSFRPLRDVFIRVHKMAASRIFSTRNAFKLSLAIFNDRDGPVTVAKLRI